MLNRLKNWLLDNEKKNVAELTALILLIIIFSFWYVSSHSSYFYRNLSDTQKDCLSGKLDAGFITELQKSDVNIPDTEESRENMKIVFDCLFK